ncbi:hypothetical protein B0H13DRAFT_1857316 [Mycena leptocephala]|nr:hypothetical protein B0H13DRAFT_1857316 [Mycena leptocephala]
MQVLVVHCSKGGWRCEVDVFAVRLPVPYTPTVRVTSTASLHGAAASLLAFPGDYCVCPFAPHPFCVDENPRLTVCTRIAYLRCEPTLRASYSIHFFGVFHNRIHESVSTTIHTASSHTGAFSIHGVVPVTRLSLDTHSNNRRSFLFLYMLVSHPGATPYDVHMLDTVATIPTENEAFGTRCAASCAMSHVLSAAPTAWRELEDFWAVLIGFKALLNYQNDKDVLFATFNARERQDMYTEFRERISNMMVPQSVSGGSQMTALKVPPLFTKVKLGMVNTRSSCLPVVSGNRGSAAQPDVKHGTGVYRTDVQRYGFGGDQGRVAVGEDDRAAALGRGRGRECHSGSRHGLQ